jgi:hypothetical protein
VRKPTNKASAAVTIPADPSPDRLAAAVTALGREWIVTTLDRNSIKMLSLRYIGRHRPKITTRRTGPTTTIEGH